MYAIWNEISQRFLPELFCDKSRAELFLSMLPHGNSNIFVIVEFDPNE